MALWEIQTAEMAMCNFTKEMKLSISILYLNFFLQKSSSYETGLFWLQVTETWPELGQVKKKKKEFYQLWREISHVAELRDSTRNFGKHFGFCPFPNY